MNSDNLLERAKHRRRLAAMAMQRTAVKRELTPKEYKDALEKPGTLVSIFGAPKDANGKPVGKAGRTFVLMEKWLDAKDKFGLPPVGPHYIHFVTREMDGAHHIWGHEEAARDLSRDIQYNFGFDPEDVVLVEEKESEKVSPMFDLNRRSKAVKPAPEKQTTEVNLTQLPPMVQPLQGPLNMSASTDSGAKSKVTKVAQFAYLPADVDDKTVLPPTPVVTQQDYRESIEKARPLSEFKKEPGWSFNPRNTAKTDLLEDLDSKDYKREPPSTTLLEEKQFDDYSKKDNKRYPVRSFISKPGIKQFAQIPAANSTISKVSVKSFVPNNGDYVDSGWRQNTIYVVGNNPKQAIANFVKTTDIAKYQILSMEEVPSLPEKSGSFDNIYDNFAINDEGKFLEPNNSIRSAFKKPGVKQFAAATTASKKK
jgi:hypothetical protein